ncbi:MAG: nucleoside hydrolase [Gemmataceae bacterium]
MAEKVILVADPGIDAAFAIAVALNDPGLDVLAVAATGGNVSPELATRNVHVVIEQLDPARWPRIGSALAVEYDRNATNLHGPDGLGGLDFPCARLHHPHPSDKLISDTVHQNPGEVTLLVLGPATAVARALDRDTDLARAIRRIVLVGGTWHEPGDAGPVTEFHFRCDPEAARQVLRCGAPVTLLPLDVTRKLVFSPADLRQLGAGDSRTARFLGKLLPMLLVPTAGMYGIEGAYLNDVLAVAAVARPTEFTIEELIVDVETRGELTRGMSVFDTRWSTSGRPNVHAATGVDVAAIRQYLNAVLSEPAA